MQNKIFDTPFGALLYIRKRCKFQINFNIRIMFESYEGISILNINENIYIPYQIYHFMKEYGYRINDIVWIDFYAMTESNSLYMLKR